jgi:predicted dehydrogenase
MKYPITVGIVGCGYWGPNLLRNFRSLPDCKMKAMCDLDAQRLKHLKALYPEVQAHVDFKKLLKDKEINAIAIATSIKHHYAMAKESLLAGKHTFIEKPMASSSEECEELISIAEKNKLTLMVGHTFLYSAPVRKIRDVVKSKDIGEIQYISSRRLNLGLFQQTHNVAWDLAPHDISIVLHISDEMPVSVNCWGNAHVTPGIHDVTNMCLNFKNDRFATIQSSWLDPKKVREMTIVGTRRMIVYDDVEPLEKIKIYDARVEIPPHYDTFAEFHYSYHYGDRYIPYIKQDEPLKIECQHFLDCIMEGKEPLTSGKQGLQVVRILEAASKSLGMRGVPVPIVADKSRRVEPNHFIHPPAMEAPKPAPQPRV